VPRSHRYGFASVLLVWTALTCAQAPQAPVEPSEAPAPPRFEIRRFAVQGNTLLPAEDVDAIVAPFTGPDRDFGTVQQALEALQQAYLDRGFNAVRVLVPEQDLVAGQVQLQVIEARIREVRVEGNKFFDDRNVRASLPSLRAGEPPNSQRIGENVQLANENPAKQTSVRLEATDQVGGVDAVARVTDENPSRITLFMDNTGNSQTGQLRVGAGYMNSNMFNRDHLFSFQAITSPENAHDVAIFGAGYKIPFYSTGSSVEVYGGHSDVDSGTVSGLFNVSGRGNIFGARFNQILPRQGAYEHKLSLGWDFRGFEQHVALIGSSETLVPNIDVYPVSVGYSGRLSRVGSEFNFLVNASHNIPGGKNGSEDAFNGNRPGAEPDYSVYRLAFSYSRLLPADFLFRLAFAGQYTNNLLVPGEQFGLGGADNVRGFYEREESYDRGMRGTVEFYSPDVSPVIDWRARFLTFFDSGRGADNEPVRNTPDGLDSAGVGVRLNRGRSIFFRADWAYVLNGTQTTRQRGSDRWHAAVGVTF